MGPARLLHTIADRLRQAGVASAAAEAGLLLEAVTGMNRFELLTSAEPLTEMQVAELEQLLLRREQREPLQLILGVAHFHGLELAVEPGVLIPRPETELLVELALERMPGQKGADVAPLVIDVGTGSGAIALAIKQARPDTRVISTDISASALDLAGRNALAAGLELQMLEADLLASVVAAAEADLVVSNPPYLPDSDREVLDPEVRQDPQAALFAGPDGLAVFRRLLKQAESQLKPGAWLLLELDPRNVQQAGSEAAAEFWQEPLVVQDLTGRDRFLVLRRTG